MAETDEPHSADTTPESGFKLAIIWAYILGGSHQVITLGVSLAMARILVPEVFGTFALANLSLLFARVLLRNGMASAVVQRRELNQRGQSTAFWILIVLSLVLAVAMAGLAPFWSRVNGSPANLTAVNRALAILLPLSVFNVMQAAVLQRRLDYRSLTGPMIIGVIAGAVTAIAMAAAGADIWALVGQQLATTVVSTTILWVSAKWRPTFEFDVVAARDLITFTGGALLSSIGEFIRNRADTIIMGLVLGPIAVGIYRFAGRFGELVVEFAVRALQGALLPGLARLQDQPERLRGRILDTYQMAALVAAVPIAGTFVAVGPILQIVGAERWGASANGMRILAFAALFQAIAFLTAPTLQAIGRPYAFAGLVSVQAAVTVAILASIAIYAEDWSLADQVTAVAVGRAATNLLAMASELVLVTRLTELSPRRLLGVIRGPVGATVLGGSAAWGLSISLDLPVWVDSLAQGVVISGVLLSLIVFDRSVRSMAQHVKPLLNR